MNTTKVGREFENKVFNYFESLLSKDAFALASQKYSKIFKHKKYKCERYNRNIDFDIAIETYNPLSDSKGWSSLIVIECKNYNHTVDIADFDEFRMKLNDISEYGVKGIIVTTRGFSRTTIEGARKSHIGLVVLSSNESQWIVSRDMNTHSENLMQILCGYQIAGLQPIVYCDGQFTNILSLFDTWDASISQENAITVPFLSDEMISNKVSQLHELYKFKTNDIAGELLYKLFPEMKITFCDFPSNVLGNLSLSDNLISISNELVNDVHRRNFTLAHEIGHLCLHEKILRKFLKSHIEYNEQAIALLPDNVIRKLEIQANKFASFLLIPEHKFKQEVSKLFTLFSITKGRLYLDHQTCNKRNVNLILDRLSQTFNVSKQAIKIRLLNTNLLIIENKGPRRVEELFR